MTRTPSDGFEDQAHELRERMKLNPSEDLEELPISERESTSSKEGSISVLELPPRSTVHQSDKTGFKWKVQLPLIRLLVIIFILLIILFPIYNTWTTKYGDNAKEVIGSEHVQRQTQAGEELYFAEPDGETEPSDESSNSTPENNTEEESTLNNQEPLIDENETETDSTNNNSNEQKTQEISDESIVSDTEAEHDSSDSEGKEKTEPTINYHIVQKGETLYSIAMKYYGGKWGEDVIRSANGFSNSEIYVGQKLKIVSR